MSMCLGCCFSRTYCDVISFQVLFRRSEETVAGSSAQYTPDLIALIDKDIIYATHYESHLHFSHVREAKDLLGANRRLPNPILSPRECKALFAEQSNPLKSKPKIILTSLLSIAWIGEVSCWRKICTNFGLGKHFLNTGDLFFHSFDTRRVEVLDGPVVGQRVLCCV